MAKPRLVPFAFACLAAGLLAACDRAGEDGAQETAPNAATSETSELAGTLDRTFAGEAVPAITVTDPSGATLDLAGTGGKPLLLNLWATWCAPCVVEMPLLDALAGEIGEDVRVVTVSEDMRGAELVEPFFAQRGFANLHPWMDPQNDLGFSFGGGPALPLTVLYDAEGKEIWRVMGAYDWSSPEARERVREALAGTAESETAG